eukprot:m.191714 g.191714  ORF g.191714 m.191714 type:complete len:85 (+) comp15648_c0_seq7:861-1115(+)
MFFQTGLVVVEILAVLKGHTSLVKGVACDPVGKYIASQGDDKTVRIWRAQTWDLEVVIKDPCFRGFVGLPMESFLSLEEHKRVG